MLARDDPVGDEDAELAAGNSSLADGRLQSELRLNLHQSPLSPFLLSPEARDGRLGRSVGRHTSSGGSRGNSLLAAAAAAAAEVEDDYPRNGGDTAFNHQIDNDLDGECSQHSGAPSASFRGGTAVAARAEAAAAAAAVAAAAAMSDDEDYELQDADEGLLLESESDGEGVDGPCPVGRGFGAVGRQQFVGRGGRFAGGGRGAVAKPRKLTALAQKLKRRRMSRALVLARGGAMLPGGGRGVGALTGVKRGRTAEEDEGSEEEVTEEEEVEDEIMEEEHEAVQVCGFRN